MYTQYVEAGQPRASEQGGDLGGADVGGLAEDQQEHGVAVQPLRVEPVGDLLSAIAAARVELRVTPRLGPLWRLVWQKSTLEFSGTRLRNALGWPEEFGAA